ncbi:hypothetical protein EON63_15320 [archaeon]|nr:MAG: hypothetical protein EON63_15320 [archaeon]
MPLDAIFKTNRVAVIGESVQVGSLLRYPAAPGPPVLSPMPTSPKFATRFALKSAPNAMLLSQQPLYTIHHTPYTIHHTPYTIHHTPYTIHHTPYTIYHTPYTIHHTPYIVHHTPYTIHHTPYTIHHTPYTIHHTLCGRYLGK